MAIWQPYRAKPCEMKNRQRTEKADKQRFCIICNKPSYERMCPSCAEFIRQKQAEERGVKNGFRKH